MPECFKSQPQTFKDKNAELSSSLRLGHSYMNLKNLFTSRDKKTVNGNIIDKMTGLFTYGGKVDKKMSTNLNVSYLVPEKNDVNKQN